MIAISTRTNIKCTDGPAGELTHVIIDPIEQQVTHLVLRQRWSPHAECLVPIDWAEAVTPEQICLNCTCGQLARVEPLLKTDYMRIEYPNYCGPFPQAGWLLASKEVEEWLPIEYICISENDTLL
jgi:hypothetical protein